MTSKRIKIDDVVEHVCDIIEIYLNEYFKEQKHLENSNLVDIHDLYNDESKQDLKLLNLNDILSILGQFVGKYDVDERIFTFANFVASHNREGPYSLEKIHINLFELCFLIPSLINQLLPYLTKSEDRAKTLIQYINSGKMVRPLYSHKLGFKVLYLSNPKIRKLSEFPDKFQNQFNSLLNDVSILNIFKDSITASEFENGLEVNIDFVEVNNPIYHILLNYYLFYVYSVYLDDNLNQYKFYPMLTYQGDNDNYYILKYFSNIWLSGVNNYKFNEEVGIQIDSINELFDLDYIYNFSETEKFKIVYGHFSAIIRMNNFDFSFIDKVLELIKASLVNRNALRMFLTSANFALQKDYYKLDDFENLVKTYNSKDLFTPLLDRASYLGRFHNQYFEHTVNYYKIQSTELYNQRIAVVHIGLTRAKHKSTFNRMLRMTAYAISYVLAAIIGVIVERNLPF